MYFGNNSIDIMFNEFDEDELVCIGKLFDKYEVNFPVNRDAVMIIGGNGAGKTLTLKLLKEYFLSKGENVLYFEDYRRLTVDDEQLDNIKTLRRLQGKDENILKRYDMSYDMVEKLKPYYNRPINSGYHQMINFMVNIMCAPKDTIVLIDELENSLHVMIQRVLFQDIYNLPNVKKLIITTHSPCLLGELFDYAVEIEKCVTLR